MTAFTRAAMTRHRSGLRLQDRCSLHRSVARDAMTAECSRLCPYPGYIFPCGYRARTLFRSSVTLDMQTVHTCEIVGAGGAFWPDPTFRVSHRCDVAASQSWPISCAHHCSGICSGQESWLLVAQQPRSHTRRVHQTGGNVHALTCQRGLYSSLASIPTGNTGAGFDRVIRAAGVLDPPSGTAYSSRPPCRTHRLPPDHVMIRIFLGLLREC